MKKLKKVLADLPHEAKFTIPMVADSTNEVWVDINTHLRNGDGWRMQSLKYGWEFITPTLPLFLAPAADLATALQIQRNTDNELLLNQNDDDVIVHHTIIWHSDVYNAELPYKVPIDTVTTQPKLRVLFRTSGDFAGMSLATVQLVGRIMYQKLDGPNVGHSKHGLLKEL